MQTDLAPSVRSEWWLLRAWTQDFLKRKFHRSIDLYFKIFAMVWRGKKTLISYRTIAEVISAHISWGKPSRHCIPNLTVQGAERSPSRSHPAAARGRAPRHSLRWSPGDPPAGKPPYKVFPTVCRGLTFGPYHYLYKNKMSSLTSWSLAHKIFSLLQKENFFPLCMAV